MHKIIDGVCFESKSAPYFEVKVHELPNGHLEATVWRPILWEEVERPELTIKLFTESQNDALTDPEAIEERRQRSLKKASDRARTRVRHLCKGLGADTLLTLTYRENVQDLQTTKKHLKEFIRRLRRVLPGFAAVAAFERQKRGAWHVHLACRRIEAVMTDKGGHRVKSFNLIRSVWRSVVGSLGGNIDVARRKATSQRSPARLASYLSKYIVKAFEEGEKWSNRWTLFGDVDIPPAMRLGRVLNPVDALVLIYDALGEREVCTSYLSKWGDVFYLAAEPPSLHSGTKKAP